MPPWTYCTLAEVAFPAAGAAATLPAASSGSTAAGTRETLKAWPASTAFRLRATEQVMPLAGTTFKNLLHCPRPTFTMLYAFLLDEDT